MAVVHFPCTTCEYYCLPDLMADHEGEEALDPKFICQQFIWSKPINELAPELQWHFAHKGD